MDDDLFTMMLTIVIAALMVVAGQIFLDDRDRTEALAFLSSLATTSANASSPPQRRDEWRP